MSNWITDNKPAALVTGIGLLLFAGLTVAGVMISSEKKAEQEKLKKSESVITTANKAAVTPTPDNVKKLEKELHQLTKASQGLKQQYSVFEASSKLDTSITANGFQNDLKDKRKKLIELCKSKGIQVTDDSSYLGFQLYATQAPTTTNTPILNFELQAIDTLVNQLAECGLTKFVKVFRAPLSVEQPATEAESDAAAEESPWTAMPIEIAFRGDRTSLFKALNIISSSKTYLFTVNSIRIRNDHQNLTPIAIPEAAKPAATPAPAQAALIPEGEQAPAKVVDEVIKPYSGKENIDVQLSLNLIHFTQAAAPEKSEK